MDFLQLFVDNALTKEAVFFLKNAYFTYMYVPVNIGEGKYIYAAYESNRKDMQNTVNLKTELKIAAFVAKGNVYLRHVKVMEGLRGIPSCCDVT